MMIMTTYVAWAERVPGVQERSQNYPINARLTQPLWTHTMHCSIYQYYISDRSLNFWLCAFSTQLMLPRGLQFYIPTKDQNWDPYGSWTFLDQNLYCKVH